MTPFNIVLSEVIILITHFVGGITVYGSSLLALPFLVWVIKDLQTPIVVLLAINAVQDCQIFFYTYRHVDWAKLRSMLGYASLGIPIGVASLQFLPQKPLLVCLGIVLILSGLSRLWSELSSRRFMPPPLLLRLLLFFGGVIHGAFASGGSMVAVYGQYELTQKETFRATLSVFAMVLNTVLVAGALLQGKVSRDAVVLFLVGLPLVLVGTKLGNQVAKHLSQQLFMRIINLLVILAGVVTIGKAIR